MNMLKQAFEAMHRSVSIQLTPGRSRELAKEIVNGANCDVAALSDERVMKEELMGTFIQGTDIKAVSWYIVFSANSMVVMVRKGNPLQVRGVADLASPEVRLVRVAGEKDLATYRTIEFIKKAANEAEMPELEGRIVETAVKAHTIPEAVQALKDGKADAGIVYVSTAIAEQQDFEYISFPDSVNLCDQIRNVLSIPATSRNRAAALDFIRFILSPEGQQILGRAGQPPLVPYILEGAVLSELHKP